MFHDVLLVQLASVHQVTGFVPKKLIAKRAFCFRGFAAMRNVPMLIQALKIITYNCLIIREMAWIQTTEQEKTQREKEAKGHLGFAGFPLWEMCRCSFKLWK
jgi:hypothetical protein